MCTHEMNHHNVQRKSPGSTREHKKSKGPGHHILLNSLCSNTSGLLDILLENCGESSELPGFSRCFFFFFKLSESSK